MRTKKRRLKQTLDFKLDKPLREIPFTSPSRYGWTTVKEGKKTYVAYAIPWRKSK